MRTAAALATAVLSTAVLAAAGCRSPFAEADESGPPEDPQKVGVGVHGWPLYERAPGSRGVRTDVLWPVASVRTSEDGTLRRADLLVPIVLWEEDGTRSRFGVRPLFDVETDANPDAEVEDVDLLFPIVKWRSAPGESRFDVRPLWWSGTEGDDEHWNVLFPLWGEWARDDGSGWFLFPFAGSQEKGQRTTDWYAAGALIRETDPSKSLDGTKALLGLLESTTWDDGAEWRVFPFASGESDASAERSEWNAIWPGFVHSETRGKDGADGTWWALPFWYSDRTGTASTDLLFPFWYEHTSDAGSTQVLFPLYGTQTLGTLERTFWGGLLWIDTEDGETGSTDVVWPLFHAGHDAQGWDARLFPVVWLDRDGDDGHTHLWPLFGSSWHGDRTTTSVAWPFFTVTSDPTGWEANLPAPFVELDRRGDDRETRVFPVFDHEWNAEDGSYEGNVLWLLSNWEGDGKGRSDFRILWRLVQDTDTGDRSVFAVNPFFRYESNPRGDVHWSTLFGLVARTREADSVDWRLLWFIHI